MRNSLSSASPEHYLQQAMSILAGKAADYTTNSRHENFERCAEVTRWFTNGIDKVYVTLIVVKLARLASLLGRKEPNNESIDDTFTDLINYCALWASKRSEM